MELRGQLRPQNKQINPSIQFRSRVLKVYSHPDSTPQKILMGNQKMENCQTRVTLASP